MTATTRAAALLPHMGTARYDAREVAMDSLEERALKGSEWSDAIVVLERGRIELRDFTGHRWTFAAGAVMSFAGLSNLTVRNIDRRPALLVAVSRRHPWRAERPPRRTRQPQARQTETGSHQPDAVDAKEKAHD